MGDIINYYLAIDDRVRELAREFIEFGKARGGYSVFADVETDFVEDMKTNHMLSTEHLSRVFKEELERIINDCKNQPK